MAFKPAKPKPVLTKPIKGFDEAVAASKKSDADTKALDGANKELKAASKELAKARAETFKVYSEAYKQLGPLIEKPTSGAPVPIPYPNIRKMQDKANKKVKVLDKKKKKLDKAYDKTVKTIDTQIKSLEAKSRGDEATGTLKALRSVKTKGKAYHQMWSMDVKVEGQAVQRFIDLRVDNKK